VSLPYTPYFINTMLDHYEDRLQQTYSDEEHSFVRAQIRFYKGLQKKTTNPIKTPQSGRMKKLIAV
jgi:hypothetical protein